jgi:hypothetical protein
MPLSSRLFRGDPALEACLVQDPAHVVKGAQGDHVGKIQVALAELDGAKIADGELAAKTYGPSTADAVLAYKTRRGIINFSYQTQADNIVGKMTIARLDTEMAAREARSARVPNCGDTVGAGSGRTAQLGFAAGDVAAVDKFPADLHIVWHLTELAKKRAGVKHAFLIAKATQLVRGFGMEIGSLTQIDDTIPNNDLVDPRFQVDTFRVRRESEKKLRGFPGHLRVIVCPFESGSRAFGVTDGGTLDGERFPFFVLINANKLRDDNCTMLHEMIHAATGLGEADHDADATSVFSVENNRSVLKPGHAKALSRSFFATPRP